MRNKLILIIFLFHSSLALSYVLNRSESGSPLKWKTSSSQIPIYVNPNPIGSKAVGVSSSSVMNILNASIDEWNGYADFSIVPIYTTSIPTNRNALYFSSNFEDFGSSVLAVTEINYNAINGNISTAKIKINESAFNSVTFTDDESQSSQLQAYLGDVFSHEIGHFLGLSHSEVIDSTMIFSVFKNQHTIHSDDYSGVLDLYNNTLYSGELEGTVVGEGSIPVFGANVFVISSKDTKVVQSQLTDENGKYHFYNLPLNDSYYIYITPIKLLDTISSYYSTIFSQYCSQKNFKMSFFTQCGPRDQGRPQGFYLSSSEKSIDMGEVTIRCDENIEPDYLVLKNETTNREFEINYTLQDTSNVFIGMFSDDEVSDGLAGMGDEYTLDLSSIDLNGASPSSYTVKLDIASSLIGSAMDLQVQVKRDDEASYTTYNSGVDETGKVITDRTINLSLSSDENDNIFQIKVLPIELSLDETYEIFSAATALSNETSLYIISTQVGQYSGSDFTPYEAYSPDSYDDNKYCSEGEISYTTQAYRTLSSSSNASDLETNNPLSEAVSCASVDFNDRGGPGGPMSFLFGVFFIFLMLNPLKYKY